MSAPLDERMLDEAAGWLALLGSGEASAEQRQAFADWQRQDPRRAQLIERLHGHLGQLQERPWRELGEERLAKVVATPSSRRRFLRNGAGLLGLGALALLAGRVDRQGLIYPGDLFTGTSERRTLLLPDGSELTLNARSRVSPDFSAGTRDLRLRGGELLLRVRQAPGAPVRILTEQGIASASQATLQMRQDDDEARLMVMSHHVELLTRDGQRRSIPAGRAVRFDGQGAFTLGPLPEDAAAWVDGRLRVRDRPLGEVIEALRAYRHGLLQISPAAARLRVSGLYPLDDSDLALRVLQATLDLRVDYLTPYWVRIDTARAA